MSDLGTHTGNAKAVLLDAAGSRHFKATTGADTATSAKSDQTFGLAAGASIVINYRPGTVDAPTTLAPTEATVTLLRDNGTTVVRTVTVASPAAAESITFFATSTGLAGGTAMAGTYRVRVEAARVSAPPLATDWRINSDNTGTSLPAGATGNDWGRGFIRGGYTLSALSYSDVSLGGAVPSNNRFVYPKSQFFVGTAAHDRLSGTGVAIGINFLQQQGLFVLTDGINTTSTGFSHTRTGGVGAASGVNNDFPAGDNDTKIRIGFQSSALSGLPWSHWVAAPTGWTISGGGGRDPHPDVADSPLDLYKIDPRIQFTQLMQLNSSTFAADPISTNTADRLPAELGFIAARARDMHGAGINGLGWTEKVWDNGNLISSEGAPAKSRSTTSQNQGSPAQAGWSDAFLTWDNSLPGGAWTQKEVLTTSKATGLEFSNSRTLNLLATSPNLIGIAGAAPATESAEATHWYPGAPLRVTYRVFDRSTRTNRTLAAPPVATALRFNPTTMIDEYLDASGAWQPSTSGPAAEHTLSVTSDPNVYSITFSNTSNWGTLDHVGIVVTGRADSVPYAAAVRLEAVGTANSHGAYALDPIALALGGVLATR